MSRKLLASLCLLHSALVAEFARAADGAASELPEATVRGESTLGGFQSRARPADLAREVTDTASLIEGSPGVHVRRLGADDSFATMSIRGSTSNQVTILFAGVPLQGGADPTVDLSTLPVWPRTQARVYRSFAPAYLGPGSLGGTLVLDPSPMRSENATEWWAAAGSFGTAKLRIGHEQKVGEASVLGAVTASRSDGDFTYFDPVASTPGHDVYAPRENAGHRSIAGLFAYRVPFSVNGQTGVLNVTAMAQARRQGVPGTIRVQTPYMRVDGARELVSLSLAIPNRHGAYEFLVWGKRESYALRDDPARRTMFLSPTKTLDRIIGTGGRVGYASELASWLRLNAGLDGQVEGFSPGRYEGGAQPPGASRFSTGLGTDLEWMASSNLSFTTSGRADFRRDDSNDVTALAHNEVMPTGHVGARWREKTWSVSLHGGALGRPPSFTERYGDRGGFVGEPSLRSESAWTVDAGAELHRGRTRRHARAELVAFSTWASDLIVFVAAGAYGRLRATNIGQARMAGSEASIDLRYEAIGLRAAYTGLLATNLSACTATLGVCDRPPLPGRPEHDFNADVLAYVGPFTLRYGFDVVSGITLDTAGSVRVPARALHSMALHYEPSFVPGLRAGAEIRNLFDSRYAEYDGVFGRVREPIGDVYDQPLPGRHVLLTVAWRMGGAAPSGL